MPGDRCAVCGITKATDPNVSFHRIPKDPIMRAKWTDALHLQKENLWSSSRVCSRHFQNGDPRNSPSLFLWKCIKQDSRAQRAKNREARRLFTITPERVTTCSSAAIVSDITTTPSTSTYLPSTSTPLPSTSTPLPSLPSTSTPLPSNGTPLQSTSTPLPSTDTPLPSTSTSLPSTTSTPLPSTSTPLPSTSTPLPQLLIAQVGEQLDTNYTVYELPGPSGLQAEEWELPGPSGLQADEYRLMNEALLKRIKVLEEEKKGRLSDSTKLPFCIEQIQHDDKLVQFYTGFSSFRLFLAFFELLGPAVDHLNFWGSKDGARKRCKLRKIDGKKQLFLVLLKLKLNLKHKDLAFRFCVSVTHISRCITTWICFLYKELKEIDWIPSVDQVFGTQPIEFREKFPSTYAIIDDSEVFIETPSDLHLQSSTWSQYKHHNTVKFLVACTPNGAIFFISPVYVGSISDVELTRLSGFLEVVRGKAGISVMADRGFIIKELLSSIGIGLNIPPFMEGRQQLPPQEIQTGRKIASLRIHIERAIGRMKLYHILKSTIPVSLARLTNQIVFICAFLTNFQPVLIPIPDEPDDSDVESYFKQLSDLDDDSDNAESSECDA